MDRFRYLLSRGWGIAALGLWTALVVSGCGGGKPDDKMVNLEGLVTYREKIALPASARLEVELLDMDAAGTKPAILGRTVVENAGQVPIGFVITYNAAGLEPRRVFAVNATIHEGNEVLFSTVTPMVVDLDTLEGLLQVVLQPAE